MGQSSTDRRRPRLHRDGVEAAAETPPVDPAFLRDTLRIRRQLAETPGLVGYGLNAQLLRKTFWTFSVWQDQASLDAFAASEPHRQITQRQAPHMHPSRFSFFTIAGADVPLSWDEVVARLDPAPSSSPALTNDEER